VALKEGSRILEDLVDFRFTGGGSQFLDIDHINALQENRF
jgi:hypothetical protein